MPGGRPPVDAKIRFLAKVKKMENGCHEWQAGLHRDGYGKFSIGTGETIPAHRAAYMLFVDQIPENAWVLHSCDNRKCVNTDHLFLGDSKINVADMDAKKRRGTKSKLTYQDVAEINEMLASRYRQEEIAQKFGIDQTTVSRIKLGKSFLFKE